MPYLSTRAIMPGDGGGRGGGGGGDGGGGGHTAQSTDGMTYFEVTHEAPRKGGTGGGRQSWPKGRGEYLEFSVYKAGRSTLEVVEALCRHLDVKRGRCVCGRVWGGGVAGGGGRCRKWGVGGAWGVREGERGGVGGVHSICAWP